MKRRLMEDKMEIDEHTLLLLRFESNLNDETGSYIFKGNISYANGVFGKCAVINKSLISTSVKVSLSTLSSFTFDFWFKANSSNSGAYILLDTRYEDYPNNRGIFIDIVSGTIKFAITSGTNLLLNLPVNKSSSFFQSWHHYAVVKDVNKFYFFIDGILEASAAYGSIPYNGPIQIGRNDSLMFYIDEFRFSNIARWTSNFTPPTKSY